MTEVKPPAVVVIGDVVGSRRAADRAVLHDHVARALDEVNAATAGTSG